jgi:hypothetical protein
MQIIENMSNSDYHSHPALSRSDILNLLRSPMHYKYSKTVKKDHQTDAMLYGSAVHDAILLPHIFENDYSFEPELDKRTTEGKKQFEYWLGNCGNRVIIPKKFKMQDILAIKNAVYDAIGPILNNSKKEISLFYDLDVGMQLNCKIRPDILQVNETEAIIYDIKTTDDASPEAFVKSIHSYQYHMQAAWYIGGVQSCYNDIPTRFIFIAVEKEAPYGVAMYELDDAWINYANSRIFKALSNYANSSRTERWESYPRYTKLTAPKWMEEK